MRQEVHDKLNALKGCKVNWDSYGGVPVIPSELEAMRGLLGAIMTDDTPTPGCICPTGRGGVGVEWATRPLDMEIETIEGGGFRCLLEWESTGPDDRLRELVARLPKREECPDKKPS